MSFALVFHRKTLRNTILAVSIPVRTGDKKLKRVVFCKFVLEIYDG